MNLVGLIKRAWEQKIVRFAFIGGFNTIISFAILDFFFKIVGLEVILANTISVVVGITISYFLNHRIVFRHPQKYSLSSYARFFLITGFSAVVIQDSIIYAITKVVVIHPQHTAHVVGFAINARTLEINIAKGVAVIVGMVWNFMLYKYVVFIHKKGKDNLDDPIVL